MQQYPKLLPGAGYGQFEHKADSLIAKFKEAGGTVRRLMYEQSHRDYLALIYLHHRLPVAGCYQHYRDNAITYKAQRDKNARELKLANAAITDMQMRQRDVCCARCKIHEGLADAKAENDALRSDVAAGRRRLHIKAVCRSVRQATASGVDNAASPRLADTAERDYFTLRRLITMPKTTGRNQSILMSGADRVAHIDGQLMQLL